MDSVPGPTEYRKLLKNVSRRAYSTRLSYQTTRGCRYNCSYCSVIRINGRGQRRRDPDRVVEDFRYLSYGGRRRVEVAVTDDDLAADREGSIEMCEALASADLPVTWTTQSSVGIGEDIEFLKVASAAGLRSVYLGLESFSTAGLRSANKKNRPNRYKNLIANMHAHEITVSAGFIFGLDGDTPNSLANVGEDAASIGVDTAFFNILVPIPGTNSFAESYRSGALEHFDWGLYDAAHPVALHPELSERDLLDLRLKGFADFAKMTNTTNLVDPSNAPDGDFLDEGWISYEADPRDLEDLVKVSSCDANDALDTAVTLLGAR